MNVFSKALRAYPLLRKEFEATQRDQTPGADLSIEEGMYASYDVQNNWKNFYTEKALLAATAAKGTDVGPWRYQSDLGNTNHLHRHFLESDDGTHDVRMYINGDFANAAQIEAYGNGIAAILNGMAVTPFSHVNARKVLNASLIAYGVKAFTKEELSIDGPSLTLIWDSCKNMLAEHNKAPTPNAVEFYRKNSIGIPEGELQNTADAAADTVETLLNIWWLKQISDAEYMSRMVALITPAK